MTKNHWKSVGAFFAGMLTGIVLSLGTDAALRAAGICPPFPQPFTGPLFLLATAYRTVYGVASAYLTARLAPRRPMKHALALGWAGLAANTAGLVVAWNKPALGPLWYPLALTVLAMPTAWMGGWLVKSGDDGQ